MHTLFKVDLHTHSILSHDGGISEEAYLNVIDDHKLDQVAITDHNEIEFALKMNQKDPEHFIVGEEIMTTEGELIGLFLTGRVEPLMTVEDTVAAIREQGGLVYMPHPFDRRRSGIGLKNYQMIENADIVEAFNARTLSSTQFDFFSFLHRFPSVGAAVGSDSHGESELGSTYNIVHELLTSLNSTQSLRNAYLNGKYVTRKVSIGGALNPSINRIRKIFGMNK